MKTSSIDWENLQEIKEIGHGGYSSVHLVQNLNNGKQYAAKVLDFQLENLKEEENSKTLNREINILSGLQHLSILQFVDFNPNGFSNYERPTILTEYLSNGSVRDILNQINRKKIPSKWNNTTKYIIIYGVASGMEFLHQKHIIHRDLKPENILLNDYFFPKISDFGLSKIFDPNDRSVQSIHHSTILYMAPEMTTEEHYNELVDVFSFAILMLEVITERAAYSEIENKRSISHLVSKGRRPEFPENVEIPIKFRQLIEKCWSQEPSNRPSFEEIVTKLENPEMIESMKVNMKDFQFYCNLIKTTKKAFNPNFIDYVNSEVTNYIVTSENSTIRRISPKFNLFPVEKLSRLSKDCQKKVKKADRGDQDMMLIVGKSLVKGKRGFPKDPELGVRYIEQSIELGNDESSEYYAELLFEGGHVSRDIEKAAKVIARAASNGSSKAKLLRARIEVARAKPDYGLAKQLYEELSDEGDAAAMVEAGKLNMKEKKEEGLARDLGKSLKYFKCSAEEGDSEGMAWYSYMKLHGFGVTDVDKAESLKYAKLSSDRSNAKGMALYALHLHDGSATERNDELASHYARLSRERGESFGYNVYGRFLTEGVGSIAQSLRESVEMFRVSSKKQDMEGLFLYGQILCEGEKYGESTNYELAFECFERSFSEGFVKAAGKLGACYIDGKGVKFDKRKGMELLKYAADVGDSESMLAYGMRLMVGENVDLDQQEGMAYLERGRELGNATCKKVYEELNKFGAPSSRGDPNEPFIIGCIYHNGIYFARNPSKALHYYLLAVDQNHSEAQFSLGVIYFEGEYVIRNIDKAIQYFTLAADQNHSEAQFSLGVIYFEGEYVIRNIDKAIQYFTLAADQNHQAAQFALGAIYSEGQYVTLNIDKAISYFYLAADQNYLPAQYALSLFFNDSKYNIRDIGQKFYHFLQTENQNVLNTQFILSFFEKEGKFGSHENGKIIHYLHQASYKNDPEAQFNLGVIYSEGKYVTRDINKAIYYFSLASNQNHPDAQFKLGGIYSEGKYVTRDIKKAIHYCTLAANQNHPQAQFNLGGIYHEGKYVTRDINKAIHYYSLAANQNHPQAQFTLGTIYSEGKYVTRDIKKAIHYYTLSANQNHPKAQFKLALIYSGSKYVTRDINKAIHYFSLAADQNIPEAQFNLGLIYSEGKYVTRDIGKAIHYFTLAANQNLPEAQFNLGVIYHEGKYAALDIGKAIHYYSLAADQNHPQAQFNLGTIYSEGKYIKRNINKSIHYFSLAADQSHPEAQFILGFFYYSGFYITKDIIKGQNCIMMASKNGNMKANFAHGFLLHEGKSVKKNIEEAINYYKEASIFNNQYAKNNLGIIYKHGYDKIKGQAGRAIEYFEEAIRQKNDYLSMYNLAHIYIYNKTVKQDIGKSIELLFKSSNKFYHSSNLLCIALIKHYGFNAKLIRQAINEYVESNEKISDTIFSMLNILSQNKLIFNEYYESYQYKDFVYDIELNPVLSSDLESESKDAIPPKFSNAKNISSEFYNGFGITV